MKVHLLKAARFILATACLIMVCSCSNLPLGTLWAMKDVDFLKVNPAVVRIALDLPAGASFKSVSLEMKLITAGVVMIDQRFDLDIATTGSELERFGLPQNPGNLVVLKVPESHIDDLLQFQNLIVAEHSDAQGGQASFGIDSKLDPAWIKANCDAGMKDLEISAWVLVEPEQGFLPLLKSSNLGKLLKAQSSGLCPSAESAFHGKPTNR